MSCIHNLPEHFDCNICEPLMQPQQCIHGTLIGLGHVCSACTTLKNISQQYNHYFKQFVSEGAATQILCTTTNQRKRQVLLLE